MSIFFFQAEAGIRDADVTGVQTCALPIFGYARGIETIAEALEVPEIAAEVRAVLAETSALLIAKHGFTPEEQSGYVETKIGRARVGKECRSRWWAEQEKKRGRSQ